MKRLIVLLVLALAGIASSASAAPVVRADDPCTARETESIASPEQEQAARVVFGRVMKLIPSYIRKPTVAKKVQLRSLVTKNLFLRFVSTQNALNSKRGKKLKPLVTGNISWKQLPPACWDESTQLVLLTVEYRVNFKSTNGKKINYIAKALVGLSDGRIATYLYLPR